MSCSLPGRTCAGRPKPTPPRSCRAPTGRLSPDDVEYDLQGLGIEELNTRAGYRPGRGYVHPAEAADEILDEVLQPFLDDLQRRAGLGMRSAAVELAAGILLGLYNCRHGNSETLLEYCPDYAAERASGVVSDCARLGIERPAVELLDLMPEWSALLP
jgi:hypothetical protein